MGNKMLIELLEDITGDAAYSGFSEATQERIEQTLRSLQQAEPVAWMRAKQDFDSHLGFYSPAKYYPDDVPLYTSPALPAGQWVKEGWKLVPVEPTENMIAALYGHLYEDQMTSYCKGLYRAMIQAAPEPPTERD